MDMQASPSRTEESSDRTARHLQSLKKNDANTVAAPSHAQSLASKPGFYTASLGRKRGMDQLTKSVMQLLLVGDEPALVGLRAQYQSAEVTSVEFSGVGAFVNFQLPETAHLVSPPNFVLQDIDLELEGLEHSITVLLFVRGGKLTMLEFAAYEPWPEQLRVRKLGYLASRPVGSNIVKFLPVADRDPDTVRRALAA